MGPSFILRSLLAWCALLGSTMAYAHDGLECLSDNGAEAWARRSYFYVGGQYVKTTLVRPFSTSLMPLIGNGRLIELLISQQAIPHRHI
jgi:hypothetical protein